MTGPKNVTTASRVAFELPTGQKDASELICPLLIGRNTPDNVGVFCIKDRCAMWSATEHNCAFRISAALPPMVAKQTRTFLTDDD